MDGSVVLGRVRSIDNGIRMGVEQVIEVEDRTKQVELSLVLHAESPVLLVRVKVEPKQVTKEGVHLSLQEMLLYLAEDEQTQHLVYPMLKELERLGKE